ncbi:glycerophosphodiester phosphodiesterase family protein [Sneathiella sp.]|jgi:glycerophosphoryl diester phosphodiesterase|uniref:glycerophosphodiester phosphodiesterase family protein n=1 Tax=Sneathiella sp. TaxID=1964365 RepID=UPI0039E6C60D
MTSNYFFDTMPRIIGHRGAKGLAPENTLASFKAAASAGAKSIEIDVTVTKDDKTVIHHDTNLNRCTNGDGPVLLNNFEAVRALDAGSWFAPEFSAEKIPTLAEALELTSELGMSLNLEVKPVDGWQIPTADIVGQQLKDDLPKDYPMLISSFSEEALVRTGHYVPHIPLGYLTDAIPPDWERRLIDTGAASLHVYHPFVTREIVQKVQAAGYKFLVYTVNDEDTATRLLDWNVDAIITDFPDRLGRLV